MFVPQAPFRTKGSAVRNQVACHVRRSTTATHGLRTTLRMRLPDLVDLGQHITRLGPMPGARDPPRCRRAMHQGDLHTIGRQCRAGFLGPLDGNDPAAVKIVGPSEMVKVQDRFRAIQIDMGQREAAAILVDEHKGRAADVAP